MVDTERERMFKEYTEILDDLKTSFMEKWKMKKEHPATLEDFERFQTLGTGAFGRVILVKYKPTSTYYAMKILDKAKLVKSKQVDHTRNEKHILQSISFPFTVFMEFCFKARIENRSNIFHTRSAPSRFFGEEKACIPKSKARIHFLVFCIPRTTPTCTWCCRSCTAARCSPT